MQSRNAFVGSFTEKWTRDMLQDISAEADAFAVHNVICEEIGLNRRSPADVAICKTNEQVQSPENILLIIEIKMSIVWNWQYLPETNQLTEIGDFTQHQGNPGLLRSDSMLKAIGKSINIRTASFSSAKIPIIIIGNTPITKSYFEKVDHLKQSGIVQGFYSVNPNPLNIDNNEINIKSTPARGFLRIDSFDELKNEILQLLRETRVFFSGMHTKSELGKMIEIASCEFTFEAKAEKFLKLLRDEQ